MSKTREIKRRIKSVKTTNQITKAMELVAAVKMKKAQEKALGTRGYSEKAREVLLNLAGKAQSKDHFLLGEREEGKTLLLVVSSDRGLCGGFNSNLFRTVEKFIAGQEGEEFDFVVAGKRASDYFRRRGRNIIAAFSKLDNLPHVVEVRPISKIIFDEFKNGKYKKVFIIFNRFISSSVQKPLVTQILPMKTTDVENNIGGDITFEPSSEELLELILPRFVETQIYQALLESNASEHSLRMITMHNATKNSEELLGDLLFSFNRLRQENITKEISEISSGAESLSK